MRRRQTGSSFAFLLVCVGGAACLIAPCANAQTFWHVDVDRPDGGNGFGWPTAFNSLQDAIDAAAPPPAGDVILVAEGIYLPSKRTVPSVPRTETFLLDFEKLSIQAGFAGFDAPDPDLRDPVAFPTILSGNIPPAEAGPPDACLNPPPDAGDCSVGNAGVPGCTGFDCCVAVCAVLPLCCLSQGWTQQCADFGQLNFPALCAPAAPGTEAYHVVTIRNVDTSVVLDGFIIESGRANGTGPDFDRGGGLLIEDAWPIIFDCTFLRNKAIEGGGVAVISDQQPIVNVIPLLLNCRFNGNVVETDGGGLHASAARPVLANCTFAGNSATPTANGQGGGVFSGGDGGEVMLVNCTLAGNEADLGGGVAGTPPDPDQQGSLASDVTLVNSVVFGNVGGESFGPVSATASCIPGVPGQGNISADPLYESAPFIGDDLEWGTIDDVYGDLRLRVGLVPPAPSPCIDGGLNAALASIMDVLDLDGDQNFSEPIPVDIRRAARFAYHAAILPPDPCLNVVAVDMGAFENSDCDGDGVRDEDQTDTNADGIADLCQDCNGNGIPDPVDLAGPNHVDCNGNGLPDYCDLINQCVADDNGNCVPNQCECTAGVIDLVFVVDTSGSQVQELDDICSMAVAVVGGLAGGNDLNVSYVGITQDPTPTCAAIPDGVATVSDLVGGNTTVPDTGAACGPGTCTQQPLDQESWGPALAIVAERNAWRPGARRIIVAVIDEAACAGDGTTEICDADDTWALCNARTHMLSNQVIVIPVTGIEGTVHQCVVDEAEALAATFASSVALHRDLFDSYNGEPPGGTRVADALLAAVNAVAASCTSVECPWDIDSTVPACSVGINDFLLLLGAWGPNPGHPADFDGDGVVGIVDFLALLGHWGPCPGVDAPPSPSLQSVVEGAGLIWPSDWDAFEATMTDPNASEAEKDRWACWMNHYLDVHSRPFFIDWPDPCPAPDPFGGH